ncbi:hypothetical protein GWI33_008317 [Rhynchophorus ferrugineus]|uniref:C2H2-type domain-containing protein n=1 Tax=Rhynchophorus ferrugineus TaxID=354439 RepID=A0A834IRJ5_RHYFE|nr:hypothetical protein GWI33_008317 [Rhynchophorus ferrugineus]
MFKHPCKLKDHLIVHSLDRPWKCDICERTFKYKRVLKHHVKMVHDKSRDFLCDICGKTFGNRRNCVVHRKRHFKEFNLLRNRCRVCGETFLNKFYLKKHIILHGAYNEY